MALRAAPVRIDGTWATWKALATEIQELSALRQRNARWIVRRKLARHVLRIAASLNILTKGFPLMTW